MRMQNSYAWHQHQELSPAAERQTRLASEAESWQLQHPPYTVLHAGQLVRAHHDAMTAAAELAQAMTLTTAAAARPARLAGPATPTPLVLSRNFVGVRNRNMWPVNPMKSRQVCYTVDGITSASSAVCCCGGRWGFSHASTCSTADKGMQPRNWVTSSACEHRCTA